MARDTRISATLRRRSPPRSPGREEGRLRRSPTSNPTRPSTFAICQRLTAIDRERAHEVAEGPDLPDDFVCVRVHDRKHGRLPGAEIGALSVARVDRLARPSRHVDRGDQRTVARVDRIPLRPAERRCVDDAAVGRDIKAIAAVPVVSVLPDEPVGQPNRSPQAVSTVLKYSRRAVDVGRDASDMLACGSRR